MIPKFAILIISVLMSAGQSLAQDPLSRWGGLIGLDARVAGPNCWNLALKDLGVAKSLRFSGPDEFRKSLNLYCRPVSEPKSESIAAITTYDNGSELHAFLMIDPTAAITKDLGSYDPTADISYRIDSAARIFSQYYKNPNDPECSNFESRERTPCASQLQYYDCDRDLIKGDQQFLSEVFPQLSRALDDLEYLLQAYHFGFGSKDLLENQVTVVRDQLQKSEPLIDSSEKAFGRGKLNLLHLRLQGLRDSVLGITHSSF